MPLISTFSAASIRGYSNNVSNYWIPNQILTASDSASNYSFGAEIALNSSNNIMAISATGNDSVYIFYKSGSTWSQVQKILPPVSSLNFGVSLCISDNGYLVIGDNSAGVSTGGGAYIYLYNGSTFVYQTFITGSDTVAGNNLGVASAINNAGSYIILGAPNENSSRGAAYVFTGSGSSWTQQQKIVASTRTQNDNFGTSVAMNNDGTAVVVGAPYRDQGATNTGMAYFYSRTASTWTQRDNITGTLGVGNNFGITASISNDGQYLIISAIGENNGEGAVYVYTYVGGPQQWSFQQKIQPNIVINGLYFGNSLGINADGSKIIVGTGILSATEQAGYIFQRVSTTWNQLYRIQVNNQSQFFAYYPTCVAIMGNNCAIGDLGQNAGGGTNSGVVDYFNL